MNKIDELININIEMCKAISLAGLGFLHSSQIEKIIEKLETLKNKKKEK